MKGMTLVLVVEGPAQTHQDHLHHPDPGGVVVVVVVVVEALLRLIGSWKHWGKRAKCSTKSNLRKGMKKGFRATIRRQLKKLCNRYQLRYPPWLDGNDLTVKQIQDEGEVVH